MTETIRPRARRKVVALPVLVMLLGMAEADVRASFVQFTLPANADEVAESSSAATAGIDSTGHAFLSASEAAARAGAGQVGEQQNIWVRARGFYRGWNKDASESITESVRNAYLPGAVTSITTGAGTISDSAELQGGANPTGTITFSPAPESKIPHNDEVWQSAATTPQMISAVGWHRPFEFIACRKALSSAALRKW
jgi:hypothetical protein